MRGINSALKKQSWARIAVFTKQKRKIYAKNEKCEKRTQTFQGRQK